MLEFDGWDAVNPWRRRPTPAPPRSGSSLGRRAGPRAFCNRPELGAVAGTIAVFAFFAIVAGGAVS